MQERLAAKKVLLEDVRKWLDEDIERGKRALGESAKAVIDDLTVIADLRVIESQLREKNGI